MDSLVNQLDNTFEVVVVDNLSTDGSRAVLEEYAASGRLKLIEKRCSRGLGRQVAFENSSGEYVIANMDTDDIFRPGLHELLEFYHRRCEGKVLAVISELGDWGQNITMARRDVLLEVGGWRDLRFAEDWDLWARAAKVKKYAWTVLHLADRLETHKERASVTGKLKFRYERYTDELRLGRSVFVAGERVTVTQRIALIFAKLALPFYVSHVDEFNKTYDSADPRYLVT